MRLLYTDETNLEERSGDFFTYAGLIIDCSKAKELSLQIDKIRNDAKIDRSFALKFNPKPNNLSHAEFISVKQKVIEAAIKADVGLLVSVILHDIATNADDARRNGINTICFHFDCVLGRLKETGLVLIDRFNDLQIDQHLCEKFSIGVTNLPHSKELRLSNVVGFHYSAIGQSHFSSLIDIVLGSLRFSINAFTRKDNERLKTARVLLPLISPLFVTVEGKLSEWGFYYSPKQVKSNSYRAQYLALQKFLAENGIVTSQAIVPPPTI